MFRDEIIAAYENGKIEQDTFGQLATNNFSLKMHPGWQLNVDG